MTLLRDRTVLVAGGAGEVGEGIVRQLLAHGARVVVPSRSAARLDRLRQHVGGADHLRTTVADVGAPGGAEQLRGELDAASVRVDAVVASLGGWWQGTPLTGVAPELWRRLLEGSLTAHFLLARAFLPLLADRAGSSYTMINGGAALYPVPTAGPVCVSAAGQLMLTRVLAAEHASHAVRINALVLNAIIRTRSRAGAPAGGLSADEVGAYAVHVASDEAVGLRGETIVFGAGAELPIPVAVATPLAPA